MSTLSITHTERITRTECVPCLWFLMRRASSKTGRGCSFGRPASSVEHTVIMHCKVWDAAVHMCACRYATHSYARGLSLMTCSRAHCVHACRYALHSMHGGSHSPLTCSRVGVHCSWWSRSSSFHLSASKHHTRIVPPPHSLCGCIASQAAQQVLPGRGCLPERPSKRKAHNPLPSLLCFWGVPVPAKACKHLNLNPGIDIQ